MRISGSSNCSPTEFSKTTQRPTRSVADGTFAMNDRIKGLARVRSGDVEFGAACSSRRGVEDKLIAAGQFNPRGHSGALFAGGLIGSDMGGRFGGDIGSDIGLAAGSLAGQRAVDRAAGLPKSILVGVFAQNVYGFDAPTRRAEARGLVFKLRRGDLQAKVHQRFNVRILELIDGPTGATVALEGSRLPVTHSGDVINALTG